MPRKKNQDDEDRDKLPVFENAPYSNQVFTKQSKEKFDQLPANIRKFTSEVLSHGDITTAADKAGLNQDVVNMPEDIMKIMDKMGLTTVNLLGHMMECLEAPMHKEDKHGNPIKDLRLKMKVAEFLLKLRGQGDGSSGDNPEDLIKMFKK